MNSKFEELVNAPLAGALLKQGVSTPTDIQRETIPAVLSGQDVIASSETGTGKTLAYLLPIFQRLDFAVKSPQAFVLAPTHELAAQIFKQAELLAANTENNEVKTALIIGGASMNRQLERLKEKPQIVVGSAGRILEIIKLKKLSAHYVKTIVLDEADRLIDENNAELTHALIKTTQKDRQLLAFSASISNQDAEKLSGLMREPVIRINAEKKAALPENIRHYSYFAEKRDKIKVLRSVIHTEHIKKAIVFLSTPYAIRELTSKLNYHGIKSVALYGAALKNERRDALKEFRDGGAVLLIASDIAARGLDIPGVSHVINFDAPEDASHYQHRAGRTGRMDAVGTVITIAENYERKFLAKYEKLYGIKIVEKSKPAVVAKKYNKPHTANKLRENDSNERKRKQVKRG